MIILPAFLPADIFAMSLHNSSNLKDASIAGSCKADVIENRIVPLLLKQEESFAVAGDLLFHVYE